ncbi:integration host factor [Escherichia coli]|nr:integration host factor [Escherichia coli]
MTKSELIERLATQQSHIPAKTVEDAVKEMLEHMASTLAQGERIEIRGFGSFSLHYRAPRTGRNPKTGDKVELEGKYVPHFKPGKELRESRQYLRLSFLLKLEREKSTCRVLFSFL